MYVCMYFCMGLCDLRDTRSRCLGRNAISLFFFCFFRRKWFVLVRLWCTILATQLRTRTRMRCRLVRLVKGVWYVPNRPKGWSSKRLNITPIVPQKLCDRPTDRLCLGTGHSIQARQPLGNLDLLSRPDRRHLWATQGDHAPNQNLRPETELLLYLSIRAPTDRGDGKVGGDKALASFLSLHRVDFCAPQMPRAMARARKRGFGRLEILLLSWFLFVTFRGSPLLLSVHPPLGKFVVFTY